MLRYMRYYYSYLYDGGTYSSRQDTLCQTINRLPNVSVYKSFGKESDIQSREGMMTKRELINRLKKYRDIRSNSIENSSNYRQGYNECIKHLLFLLKTYDTELLTMTPVEISGDYEEWKLLDKREFIERY